MKIAIVYPEVYDIARFGKNRKEFPPFGVLYLATIVSAQNGMEVKVFSVGTDQDTLDLTTFDVVAFSIPSSATYDVIKNVRFNSIYAHDTLVIAGGVHANIFPIQTLQELKVHAVNIGHGDETILELIHAKRMKQFSHIKGICYMKNGNPRFTEQRALKKNLDYWPIIPARHLLPESDFIMTNRLSSTNLRMTHVMFSQGCPYSCNFCAGQQKQMQYRPGWHIRQELEHLKNTYGIEGFAVVDDNFLVNKRRVRDICESICDLDLKWSILSRVDTVSYDDLEIIRDAGCIEIKFGVESGSEKILKAMGKGISVNQIYNAIKMTHSAGIKVKNFIVHGYPGENMETTQETITLLDDLWAMIKRVSLFRFVPLPGSRVYNEAEKNKLHLKDNDWKKCHIHHNPNHWWGDKKDFHVLEESYKQLAEFILKKWG
ncbi:MAG: radical SAM protein [Candidatus Pacebacteria bacterium]|nr:radical SAM protein [Candidatus Paceibacterota bacterium]MDR3582893.1 radical SAM protein [Candidatus Paceibacterota bacterium]